jgi:hypothetical protein
MDRRYIQDHQVVERYLDGRLTPSEQEAFEEFYLAHPDVLEELELTERLRQGIKDLGEAGELERSLERPRSWKWALSTPQYAAAASLLFAASLIVSGTLYRDNAGLRQELELVAGSAVTRLVPIISVRGNDVNQVAEPVEREWTVLLVEPGPADYDSFRATVLRQDRAGAEPIWELGGLVPGYDGLLPVGVPGGLLEPGDYEVRVAGRMADWPPDRGYEEITGTPFRITPAPGR